MRRAGANMAAGGVVGWPRTYVSKASCSLTCGRKSIGCLLEAGAVSWKALERTSGSSISCVPEFSSGGNTQADLL